MSVEGRCNMRTGFGGDLACDATICLDRNQQGVERAFLLVVAVGVRIQRGVDSLAARFLPHVSQCFVVCLVFGPAACDTSLEIILSSRPRWVRSCYPAFFLGVLHVVCHHVF